MSCPICHVAHAAVSYALAEPHREPCTTAAGMVLTASDIKLMCVACLTSLPRIDLLKIAVFAALPTARLRLLTEAQLAQVSSAQWQALSSAQLRALPEHATPDSRAALSALAPWRVLALRPLQLQAIYPWCSCLSEAQCAVLRSSQIATLISAGGTFSVHQVNAMEASALAGLSATLLRRLRSGLASLSSPDASSGIGDAEFLHAGQVRALKPEKLAALVGDGSVSVEAMAALRPCQAAALSVQFFSRISDAMLAALSRAVVDTLSSQQRRALWGGAQFAAAH